MTARIWKRVNGELVGFGNGHRAVIYETKGLPYVGDDDMVHTVEPIFTVLVHKGDKRVAKQIEKTEAAVKRWAERNYLKGTT